MRHAIILGTMIILATGISHAGRMICDADSDCFYAPGSLKDSTYYPALLILSCTGATAGDIDSVSFIADSLGIFLASCHKSRNHRDIYKNDKDICYTLEKLVTGYNVDPARIYIYGFSGMGVQALMALLTHPGSFRGAISACAHRGAIALADWPKINDPVIYLISREDDFNIDENKYMHNLFRSYYIIDTLVITPGKHQPATRSELLDACLWVIGKTAPGQ